MPSPGKETSSTTAASAEATTATATSSSLSSSAPRRKRAATTAPPDPPPPRRERPSRRVKTYQEHLRAFEQAIASREGVDPEILDLVLEEEAAAAAAAAASKASSKSSHNRATAAKGALKMAHKAAGSKTPKAGAFKASTSKAAAGKAAKPKAACASKAAHPKANAPKTAEAAATTTTTTTTTHPKPASLKPAPAASVPKASQPPKLAPPPQPLYHPNSDWEEPPPDYFMGGFNLLIHPSSSTSNHREAATTFGGLTLYDVHRKPRRVVLSPGRMVLKDLAQDLFRCVICLSTLRKTKIVRECLHRFCEECVERALRVAGRRNECPICRAFVPSRRSLAYDVGFDNLVRCILGPQAVDGKDGGLATTEQPDAASGNDAASQVRSPSFMRQPWRSLAGESADNINVDALANPLQVAIHRNKQQRIQRALDQAEEETEKEDEEEPPVACRTTANSISPAAAAEQDEEQSSDEDTTDEDEDETDTASSVAESHRVAPLFDLCLKQHPADGGLALERPYLRIRGDATVGMIRLFLEQKLFPPHPLGAQLRGAAAAPTPKNQTEAEAEGDPTSGVGADSSKLINDPDKKTTTDGDEETATGPKPQVELPPAKRPPPQQRLVLSPTPSGRTLNDVIPLHALAGVRTLYYKRYRRAVTKQRASAAARGKKKRSSVANEEDEVAEDVSEDEEEPMMMEIAAGE